MRKWQSLVTVHRVACRVRQFIHWRDVDIFFSPESASLIAASGTGLSALSRLRTAITLAANHQITGLSQQNVFLAFPIIENIASQKLEDGQQWL